MRERRHAPRLRRPDLDPLALLVNVFDCGLVFSLAVFLMGQRTPTTSAADSVPEDRHAMVRFSATDDRLDGEGQRLGVAYRLPSGEVVYVPDTGPATAPR
jgi:hypothetical protein